MRLDYTIVPKGICLFKQLLGKEFFISTSIWKNHYISFEINWLFKISHLHIKKKAKRCWMSVSETVNATMKTHVHGCLRDI